MLSLMAKDMDIARYCYQAAPHNYQLSRYPDWIRNYLEGQKADVERSNALSYFKNKLETIKKSLELLEKYEVHMEAFKKED